MGEFKGRKDNGELITRDEWNRAVELLLDKVPAETFAEVKEEIDREGDSVLCKRHDDLGRYVRNLIRGGGFNWGAICLDMTWMDLFEEALTTHSSTDFEEEIRRYADTYIGRTEELTLAKELIMATPEGVLWITGKPGIGKSRFMAKLTYDLKGDAKDWCRVAYRFSVGSLRRARNGFFKMAIHRIGQWLGESVDPSTTDNDLHTSLHKLLKRVSEFTPEHPSGKVKRVIFVLDGMDKIAKTDPEFPRLPFQEQHKNVLWVCAGRTEGILAEIYAPENCIHIFGPEGLPATNLGWEQEAELKREYEQRKREKLG